ncbi:Protein of unknown function [Bacillus wiedmannii]|nr:Protein of unknown function [Bacillus wiedmannii]
MGTSTFWIISIIFV